MYIEVRMRGCGITSSIREWSEQRVMFALGEFKERLRFVHVRLSDQNGPKGGVDQKCLMEARFTGGGTVVTKVSDSDAYTAISRAAARLGRRVGSIVDRQRTRRRSAALRAD